jgi:hypothetical protein
MKRRRKKSVQRRERMKRKEEEQQQQQQQQRQLRRHSEKKRKKEDEKKQGVGREEEGKKNDEKAINERTKVCVCLKQTRTTDSFSQLICDHRREGLVVFLYCNLVFPPLPLPLPHVYCTTQILSSLLSLLINLPVTHMHSSFSLYVLLQIVWHPSLPPSLPPFHTSPLHPSFQAQSTSRQK